MRLGVGRVREYYPPFLGVVSGELKLATTGRFVVREWWCVVPPAALSREGHDATLVRMVKVEHIALFGFKAQ